MSRIVINEIGEPELHAVWCVDDVLTQADKQHMLTRKEAGEILETMARRHDACIGINWDVMDIYIDDFVDGARTPPTREEYSAMLDTLDNVDLVYLADVWGADTSETSADEMRAAILAAAFPKGGRHD